MRRLTQPRIVAALWLAAFAGAAALAQAPGQLPPPPKNAPNVGEKAPDFTLPDTANKPVKLFDLLAETGPRGQKGSWVLLIFYRGYW